MAEKVSPSTDKEKRSQAAAATDATPAQAAEREAALRQAIENSMLAGVSAVNARGRQIYANPAFCEMLGWSAEELIGLEPPFPYWPPEEQESIDAALARTLAGDLPAEGFELRFRRRNGERFDVLVLVSPLKGASFEAGNGWLACVYDITERKRAVRRAEESERRLQMALAAGRLGTWKWDAESGRVSWSEEVERSHGYAPGTFPGTFEAFKAGIHPEDRERVLSAIRQALDGTREYELDYRIVRHDDGAERWLMVRGKAQLDEKTGATAMHGVCSDITQRKRREQAQEFLADATRLFSSSLDHQLTLKTLARMAVPRVADYFAVHLATADGGVEVAEVTHSDPDREEVAWDIARRWPTRREPPSKLMEAIDREQSLLLPRVSREDLSRSALDTEHERAMHRLGIHSVMIVPLKATGPCFGALTFIGAESRRQYDEEDRAFAEAFAGRAALALENARLFEQAARARQSAERAEARIRLLAETSNLLASVQTPEDGLKVLAELAVEHFADYCVTYTCDGKRISRVGLAHADPDQRALVVALDSGGPPTLEDEIGAGRVIRTGEAIFVPTVTRKILDEVPGRPEYRRAVQRLAPCSSIVLPLQARGRTIGAVAFACTGRSQHHYDEEDLRLAQELAGRAAMMLDNARLYREAQEAVQTRDELMAIVSHDLRNPLNTVLTACSVLELGPPADRRAEAIASIRRAAGQMHRLVRDLLDISCIEGGGLSIQLRPTELVPLLEEACALFRVRAEEMRAELRLCLPEELPSVLADRERLLQVLANLLDNAFKHVPAGGRVEVAAETGDGVVTLMVSDDGPGIPAEQQARVFDRFWQSEQEKTAGAGLGLAIAKGIVEAHGGGITLCSASGSGTQFRFTLQVSRSGDSGYAPRRPAFSRNERGHS